MKIGLCLGAGGSRGYAHIGAIRALTEAGIKIDLVNGTSMGAIMGGMYALYMDVDEMTDRVRRATESVNVNHFNLFQHPKEGSSFLQNWLTEAICDMAALRKSIQSHKNNLKALRILLDEARFEDTKIPFSAITMDIMTGKTTVIKKGKLIDGVLASASIPGIFPPVARSKKLLVDGFVLANIPAPELRQQGADFIISIGLEERPNKNFQNGVDLIYYVESIKQKQLDKWAIAESDFHINIEMTKFDATHFENYEVAIKHGYNIAKKSMPLLVKKLEKINV